ncbi:hypothetical protein ACHAXM_000236, partial [Skeletonema potamos]
MDFSKESYTATYTKVADGTYVVSETHRPHHKDSMPELNNRAFLYEVTTAEDGKHLLMSGMPGSKAIEHVKQLEKDLSLSVKTIVTSGDFHHMSMKGWLDAFPDTTFVHSALKFPTTRNGKEILDNESYKKRIILEKDFDLPSLKKYSDTVKFYGFNQFMVYADAPFMTESESKATNKKQNILSYMSKIGPCDQPFLAIWSYHVPTKQLVIEHNFMIYMTKEQVAKATSFVLRMMMKTEDFSSCANQMMPVGPKSMVGCKAHCKQMAQILKLDVRAIIDYHSYPGVQIRTYESKDAYVKDFGGVLAKTGENDPTGEK